MKISEIQGLDTSGTSPTFGTLVQMTLLQTSLNLQLSVQLRHINNVLLYNATNVASKMC